MKKTIAVDFDGVLHGYSKKWHEGTIYDEPVPGAAAAMQALLDAGYEISVYSTRCHSRTVNGKYQPDQAREIEDYLRTRGIPFTNVHVGAGKPLCVLFIDDNAFRFTGDWAAAMPQIEAILEKRPAPAPEEGNLVRYAREELQRIGEEPGVIENFLDVMRAFSAYGHSGGSASVCIPRINQLLRFRPIAPLTGEDDEWNDVSHAGGRDDGPLWQNRRCGEVFKDATGAWILAPDDCGFTMRKSITFPYQVD
jgi:hypothetical protein